MKFTKRIIPYLFAGFSAISPNYVSNSSKTNLKESIESFAKEEFIDTDKPNALLTIPEKDDNDAFREEGYFNFFKEIKSAYDVKLRIISDERDLCYSINNTPNLELLVIGGHGRPNYICFAEHLDESKKINQKIDSLNKELSTFLSEGNICEDKNITIKKITDQLEIQYKLGEALADRNYLSPEDTMDLKLPLSKLKPNATIYLQACHAGEGNIVDCVKEVVGRNVRVFGVKASYQIKDVEIKELFPLEINVRKYSFENKRSILSKDYEEIYERR